MEVGRKGGLVVGLGMLRPSSLVNSAVEVVLCVLQAEAVLRPRIGDFTGSSSSLECSFSEFS